MSVAVLRRAHALGAVTAALRGDDHALPATPDDWSAFLELAATHELLPAVWVARQRVGDLTVPASVARVLELATPTDRAVPEAVIRGAFDRNRERVDRLLGHGVDVLQRLAAAGARAVPLKGLHALLVGTWPVPAARTMADLDVLVAAEHSTRAYDVLRASGYEEHPDPIGEHADHHLPMLCDGDVTVELHVEPLVSRWRSLVPAAHVLARAARRRTDHGALLLADDTDAFVHLVGHAQLQDETHRLLGLPLRALLETAHVDASRVDWGEVRLRFSHAAVAHVLDAHLHGARHWFRAAVPPPSRGGEALAAVHTRLAGLGVAEPAMVAAWAYAVRVPHSFTVERMEAEFGTDGADGADGGARWLWGARIRHAARRVDARLTRRGASRAQ
jgi:hypothetical protein